MMLVAAVRRPLGGAAETAAGACAGGWREIWAQILQQAASHHGERDEGGTRLGIDVREFMKTLFIWPLHTMSL